MSSEILERPEEAEQDMETKNLILDEKYMINLFQEKRLNTEKLEKRSSKN